jgi:hypothetical protein
MAVFLVMFMNVSKKRDWLQIILSRHYLDANSRSLQVFRNGARLQQLQLCPLSVQSRSADHPHADHYLLALAPRKTELAGESCTLAFLQAMGRWR